MLGFNSKQNTQKSLLSRHLHVVGENTINKQTNKNKDFQRVISAMKKCKAKNEDRDF